MNVPMFVTKRSLTRRAFLRGAGAAIALPLLDAMTPALAAAATPVLRRLGFVYVPNGVIMDQWTPETDGPEFGARTIGDGSANISIMCERSSVAFSARKRRIAST